MEKNIRDDIFQNSYNKVQINKLEGRGRYGRRFTIEKRHDWIGDI
jgi:hypothetical protein